MLSKKWAQCGHGDVTRPRYRRAATLAVIVKEFTVMSNRMYKTQDYKGWERI